VNFDIRGQTRIDDNRAGGNGGGISIWGATSQLELRGQSRVGGNNASYGAGGFIDNAATAIITSGTVISENYAWIAFGGLEVKNGATCTIIGRSIVRSNRAVTHGGGVGCRTNAKLTVGGGSRILGNHAQLSAGGVVVASAAAIITDGATISDNTALRMGGGVHVASADRSVAGALTVTNQARIERNRAVDMGGGISLGVGVTARIDNSIVRANYGQDGGGIHLVDGTDLLIEGGSVVADNHASRSGGGIMVAPRPQGYSPQARVVALTLVNVRVRGNVAAEAGGGLTAKAGTVMLRNGTFFSNNTAAGSTNNIHLPGAAVYYTFPVPPGYWLPNSECRVYREQCPVGQQRAACLASFDACSLTADNVTAGSGQLPAVPASSCDNSFCPRSNPNCCADPQLCTPRAFTQRALNILPTTPPH
jgi:hypothetical protein